MKKGGWWEEGGKERKGGGEEEEGVGKRKRGEMKGEGGEGSREDSNLFLWSFTVITIIVYHLGCFIEYIFRLHDGARVFPVHGMW